MRLAVLILCGGLALAQAATGIEEAPTQREKVLFFASSLTTTFMSVSTLTSIVPFTCFTAPNTQACQGKKKKKRSLINYNDKDFVENDLELDPSDLVQTLEKEDSANDSGKFLFTVWKTSYSTKTTTSFSTNRGITVSVHLRCTIAGIQTGASPVCGTGK